MLRVGDDLIRGYRLVKFLGRGSFGEVWRTTSPGGVSLALKILNLEKQQGWKEFRAIQRVKAIRHPNLIPIIGIWLLDECGNVLEQAGRDELDGGAGGCEFGDSTSYARPLDGDPPVPAARHLIVASVLCDGSVADRLNECRRQGLRGIPESELLDYMAEAAKGIDHLNSPRHKWGGQIVAVQHCDIKPDNLLLLGGGVVVGDFGVAQVLAAGRTRATCTSPSGSLAYMAPECLDQKPSFASDQYSLAVTYVELRTGKLPFRTETCSAIIQAHRSGDLDLSNLSASERKVIRKAAAVRPEARYPSVCAMVRELRDAIENSGRRASRWSWRLRTLRRLTWVNQGWQRRSSNVVPSGQSVDNSCGLDSTATLEVNPSSSPTRPGLWHESIQKGFASLRRALAEPIFGNACRQFLDSAIHEFSRARAAATSDSDLAQCLVGLGFSYLEQAVHASDEQQRIDVVLTALQCGQDAAQITSHPNPEHAWNIVGQAHEQLAHSLGESARIARALDAYRHADAETVRVGHARGRSLTNLGRCLVRAEDGEARLSEAVKVLDLATNLALTPLERVEAHHWLGVAYHRRAGLAASMEVRREWLVAAESSFYQGSQSAWEYKIHRLWPILQIKLGRCLFERDVLEARKAIERVLDEGIASHFESEIHPQFRAAAEQTLIDIARKSEKSRGINR